MLLDAVGDMVDPAAADSLIMNASHLRDANMWQPIWLPFCEENQTISFLYDTPMTREVLNASLNNAEKSMTCVFENGPCSLGSTGGS